MEFMDATIFFFWVRIFPRVHLLMNFDDGERQSERRVVGLSITLGLKKRFIA